MLKLIAQVRTWPHLQALQIGSTTSDRGLDMVLRSAGKRYVLLSIGGVGDMSARLVIICCRLK
jgi:hypothetical protein